MKEKQSTNHIFMVKPVEFYMNPQTSESNHYQIEDKEMRKEAILEEAIKENGYTHGLLKFTSSPGKLALECKKGIYLRRSY